MGKPRRIADLLADTGDVKSEHLGNVSGHTPEGTAVKSTGETGGTKFLREDGDNTSSWQTISIPSLDSPSITGTLFVDDGSTVSHTISNWSDDVSYTITPTNCTVGAVNSSGVFVVTHTSGNPSYTIVATTDSLGLDNSSTVTKNIVINLSAPTLSSPADVGTATDVVYTITSTDSNDDKIILDMGTSSFTFGSVSVGSGTKVGNTVEVTGFTTGNPAITVQFTALGTYSSVKAKSTKIDASYGDSDYSSTDSILIYEQLSAPSLNAPADSDDATAVTYTISSIDSNATKVIFDAQSSNFTYGSVGSGSGSKVGNTVEITGWSGTSVTVTLTYTTVATYSNRANVTSTSATYTDSAWSSTDSIVISASFTATGGAISTYSSGGVNYKAHTFTSSGTFTAEASGSVDILMVAGGGGGGGGYQGAGGGAGGMLVISSHSVVASSYSISIGGGGNGCIGGSSAATSGGNTTFTGLTTALGGGRGGSQVPTVDGQSGGSGAGGNHSSGLPAKSGTSGQGNAGGAGYNPAPHSGGGGGGKGATGSAGLSDRGGAGGTGAQNSYQTGSNIYYAGGGAGSCRSNVYAYGGSGGGGRGGNGHGVNGTANTGGGGGAGRGADYGGSNAGNGGNGGSGIVIIRYAV